jgi:hypothetical protein
LCWYKNKDDLSEFIDQDIFPSCLYRRTSPFALQRSDEMSTGNNKSNAANNQSDRMNLAVTVARQFKRGLRMQDERERLDWLLRWQHDIADNSAMRCPPRK